MAYQEKVIGIYGIVEGYNPSNELTGPKETSYHPFGLEVGTRRIFFDNGQLSKEEVVSDLRKMDKNTGSVSIHLDDKGKIAAVSDKLLAHSFNIMDPVDAGIDEDWLNVVLDVEGFVCVAPEKANEKLLESL